MAECVLCNGNNSVRQKQKLFTFIVPRQDFLYREYSYTKSYKQTVRHERNAENTDIAHATANAEHGRSTSL